MREWGAEDKKNETIKGTTHENLESPIDLKEPFEKQKIHTKRIIPKKRKITFLRVIIFSLVWYIIVKYWINNPGFIGVNIQTAGVIIAGIIMVREITKGGFIQNVG